MRGVLASVLAAALLLPAAAMAEVFLPGHEVADAIVGNTLEGRYRECAGSRMDFKEYYTLDGKIRGKERPCNQVGDWTQYQGEWSVRNGKFCVALGSGRPNGCFDYEGHEGGELTRAGQEGVAQVRFAILEGNPDHL